MATRSAGNKKAWARDRRNSSTYTTSLQKASPEKAVDQHKGVFAWLLHHKPADTKHLLLNHPFRLVAFASSRSPFSSLRCCHRRWWRIRQAPVNHFRAGFHLIRRDQGGYLILSAHALVPAFAFTSTKPPHATSPSVFSRHFRS